MTKPTEGPLKHAEAGGSRSEKAEADASGWRGWSRTSVTAVLLTPRSQASSPDSGGCQQPLVSLGLWPQRSDLCLEGHTAFPPSASSPCKTAAALARGPPCSGVAASELVTAALTLLPNKATCQGAEEDGEFGRHCPTGHRDRGRWRGSWPTTHRVSAKWPSARARPLTSPAPRRPPAYAAWRHACPPGRWLRRHCPFTCPVPHAPEGGELRFGPLLTPRPSGQASVAVAHLGLEATGRPHSETG